MTHEDGFNPWGCGPEPIGPRRMTVAEWAPGAEAHEVVTRTEDVLFSHLREKRGERS